MSFTDDENKRIEDEESRIAEEIRAKFQSMFSEEEPKKTPNEPVTVKPEPKAASLEQSSEKRVRQEVPARPAGGRVVKKVNVTDSEFTNARVTKTAPPVEKKPQVSAETKVVGTRPSEKPPVQRSERISKADPEPDRKKEKKKKTEPAEPKRKRKESFSAPDKKTRKKEEKRKRPAKPAERPEDLPYTFDEPEEVYNEPQKRAAEPKKSSKGPAYSINGHKILTDSNYKDELPERVVKSRPKPASGGGYTERPASRGGYDNRESYREPYRTTYRKESTSNLPKSVFVANGIQWFRQDAIPPAGNEQTRSDGLNHTRKVRKRERKALRAGKDGSREYLRGVQVSVYSPEASSETSIISGLYGIEEPIAAKGKVNPNTARISRSTIERMLKESEDAKASGKQIDIAKRKAVVIPEYDRHRTVNHRRSAYRRPDAPQLRTIDNSRKKRKQRQKRTKPSGPGGKIAAIVILIIFLACCTLGFMEAKNIFDDAAMDPEDMSKIEYTITDGTTDDAVAEFLVSNGMVESKLMYLVRAKIFDADYVAGTYELSPSYSTEKIINILSGFDYSGGSN